MHRSRSLRIATGRLVVVLAALAGAPSALAAQLDGPIPPLRLVSGRLSFDGHATAGDFTGTTTAVSGATAAADSLGLVEGWVEAPVKSLETGNGKRDRDLNKSMESDRHPTMRFELSGATEEGSEADTALVRLRGKLTLHGVTRAVSPLGRLWKAGDSLHLRTGFPLDLGDYEVGGLSRMMGMLRMSEDIEVRVSLVFAPS
ncbi:MAG TPA: YceI family protein [Gemmatimonadales bacterium]|nr:YceI family protein [Gemmatimonadales bacterium]